MTNSTTSHNLCPQGISVPRLGFGTWRLNGAECTSAVRVALETGYRHFDTAQLYRNETEVGRALRDSGINRESVFLTTKLWRENLAAPRLQRSVEESLQRLGTEYVDLLLVHWPNPGVALEHSLEGMTQVQAEGKVRHLGVSNFPPSMLRRALSAAHLTNIQVEYHPYLSQDALLAVARESELFLTAYSPLAKGLVFEDETLKAIGSAHGKSAGQVALRWLVEQDAVAAIPRSSDAEHIRSNFDLWDFELSAEETNRIAGLASGRRLINPASAPDWERSDEAEWFRGYRVPASLGTALRAGRWFARKLRRGISSIR